MLDGVTLRTRSSGATIVGERLEAEALRLADEIVVCHGGEGVSTRATLPDRSGRLPARLRAFFARMLGHDFSGVRIHCGAHAAEFADKVGAAAFAVGRDVGFGA